MPDNLAVKFYRPAPTVRPIFLQAYYINVAGKKQATRLSHRAQTLRTKPQRASFATPDTSATNYDMSCRRRLWAECLRTPIALSLNAIMLVATISAIVMANDTSGSNAVVGVTTAPLYSVNSNRAIWLTLAVFIGATSITASIARFLYKVNAWVYFTSSIALAVFSLFVTMWTAQQLGVASQKAEAWQAFDNLIFYGTLIIYLALAGGRPLLDLARDVARSTKGDQSESSDGFALVGLLVIVVSAWGGLVGSGQAMALKAFL